MARRRSGLTWKIQADGKVGRRLDVERHGVADKRLPAVERRRRLAAERQGAVASGDDGGAVGAQRHMSRTNGDGRCAKGLGQPDPHAPAPDARPDDHAQRLPAQAGERRRDAETALRRRPAIRSRGRCGWRRWDRYCRGCG